VINNVDREGGALQLLVMGNQFGLEVLRGASLVNLKKVWKLAGRETSRCESPR
jgi:hypothetical protein